MVSRNTVAFLSVARDALQLYAEYFKYKVYFCKGHIQMRDFILTTRWCRAVCFVAVDHCELSSVMLLRIT